MDAAPVRGVKRREQFVREEDGDMTRRAAWVVFATVAAVAFGCKPAKELPSEEEVVKPADAGEKPVTVPAASDPKAKAYVEKAVKAFTAGKPDVLAKGKASRVTLKGRVHRQDAGGMIDTARTIAAVWPDRLTGIDDSQIQGQRNVVSVYLHRPQFAVLFDGREREDLPGRAEMARNFAADETAQHWMALLLPLVEPKAVVFDLQSTSVTAPQTGEQQAVHLLRVSLPDLPLYQLAFDAKTDVLIRVEYLLTEQGTRRRKQWSVLEHNPGPDGQLLPTKIEMRHDGSVVEQWQAEKWEFPATIPDAEFSPPRQ
jgi:hypothetical protein